MDFLHRVPNFLFPIRFVENKVVISVFAIIASTLKVALFLFTNCDLSILHETVPVRKHLMAGLGVFFLFVFVVVFFYISSRDALLRILTSVLFCTSTTDGLVTTEDNTARVEEAAKQIDGDEHDQYHGDNYPSYGSRSESGLSASANFRCDYKKIQNTSIFAQQMDTGHLNLV